MSMSLVIPYQPLAKSLPPKSGTKKVTDEWLVTLPINQLDPIKLEWLDDIHLIAVLPTDSATKIEKINIDTGLRIFLCEGDIPKPSPDGQSIVFIKSDKKERQLWLMRPDGTELKQLTYITEGIKFGFYKYNFNLVWSHDSTLIALLHSVEESKSAIDVINIHTGQIKRILTTDQFQLRSVLWSHDDKELFFWKEQTEGESNTKDQESIQAIQLNDESIRTLVQFDGLQQMLNPTLSPDGKYLAITFDPEHPFFDTTQNIGLIPNFNNDASSVKQLTYELKLISHQWSPDSKYIYALRVYGAYRQIYRIDIATGEVKQITEAPFSIDWRAFALSPNGSKFAFSAINAHGTQVIRLITTDGKSVRDLMTVTSATDDMALSEIREIEWDTMNYPVRMRGLFILPLDYQEGISYPLIIDIHGGGSGASLQLDGAILVSTPLEWQMWAAKGYAVFVPEFRSSGAFGGLADTRDHYKQHDLINQDIVDIENGVNKLISDGFIDPDRMVIIAHSAGARRANWLVATRHQFRAVISKEGWADELHAVSNPIQTYPLNRVYKHFGGSPKEVPENYLKNSALHYAKDATIPTLFLMGNPELGGIDFAGTVKLFHDEIKSKNVETELIYYPDEGHVFEKISNRLDALKRSQKWINQHTQKQSLSDQRIMDCLNTDYGIKVATLTCLPLGADINAFVYKAETHNQSSYFVKLKRGHHHDISTIIISLLHDVGIKQVILPIKTNRGQSTQHIDNFTLIVSPFVEGQDGFSRDLTEDQWITLGRVMKHIHEIDVPFSVQARIRREDYSSKWREVVRSLYTHIATGPSGDEIALQMLTFMKNHAPTIHRLVDRAEQLCKKVQEQSIEFVLCHSDIHGGNVLMDGNDIIYMVDWDDPIMAPKERDLMFIGGGVANVWNKQHEEEFFYKGYGNTEINMTALAYYRHERIVQDIAEYGQQLLLTSIGDQNRMEAYKHFVAQFEPQGVVEIAFRTDDNLRML